MPANPRAAFTRSTILLLALAGSYLAAGSFTARADEPAPILSQPSAPAPTPAPAAELIASTGPAATDGSALTAALQALTPDEQIYHQHVVTLSSPFFEGRAPGLRGNALAQEYLEFYFREKFKLDPLFPVVTGDSTVKSYRQEFDAGRENIVTNQRVVISSAGKETELTVGTDYNVLGMSASGEATGDLVFCGYGIDEGIDDYATYSKDDDLTGKIAVILRFEPQNDVGKSKWSKTGAWSPKAGLGFKLAAARDRGAIGMILVNPPTADDPRTASLEDFRSMRGLQGSTPVVMMSIEQMTNLCKSAGQDFTALVKSANAKGGLTPLTGVKATLAATIERKAIKTANVAGVLRGKGPLADEFIIIGGHFDHLGYGYFGSRSTSPAGKLHPGADDNASGIGGVLLAAQHLSEAYKKLGADANVRSIMFIGFSAEESGLIGSNYYIRNAPVSADKSYIMINMDMIGRLRNNKFDVGGGGSGDGLCDLIDPIFAASGINVKTRNAEGIPFNGRGPSDHASFFRGGIPVLFFFTGLHPQYHTAIDLYPLINVRGAVKIVETVVTIATTLGSRTEPLPFNGEVGQVLNPDYSQTVEKTDAITSKKPAPKNPEIKNPQAQPASPVASNNPADAASKPAANPHAPAANPHGAAPATVPGRGNAVGDNEQPTPPPVRVRFGVAPGDYSDDTPGVLVGDVFPDTPAALAGLKKDDRLTKWNDTVLRDIDTWMPLLRAAKPGDIVTITYVRGKETKTTKATLTARDDSPK